MSTLDTLLDKRGQGMTPDDFRAACSGPIVKIKTSISQCRKER